MGASQSTTAHTAPAPATAQPPAKPAVAAATASTGAESAPNPKNPNGLKPCCVCLETKKARDTCFFEKGDEAEQKCHYLILAHRKCMEDLGFTV